MIITASRWATTYYTSYSRALLSYTNNGFFSRDLDADDHAFIESIRERGSIACGSLADPTPSQCTYSDDVIHRTSLLEEDEFWRLPYTVDNRTVRRQGPVQYPRTLSRAPGTTPNAEQMRQRRELAAKALAEEHQRLVDRQIEQLRRDIEWERASVPFGRVKNRHYVPQWKADEARSKRIGRRKINRDIKRTEISKEARDARLDAAVDRRRAEIAIQNEARAANKAKLLAALEEFVPEFTKQDQRRLEINAIRREEEARQNRLADLKVRAAIREDMKRCILTTVRNNFPNPVTIDALLIATRCDDKEFLIQCADELVREGRLGDAGKEPA
jgi:hypothetical protein